MTRTKNASHLGGSAAASDTALAQLAVVIHARRSAGGHLTVS